MQGSDASCVVTAVDEDVGTPRGPWLLAVLVALIVVILFLPSFDDAGPEMDEGVLVSYPSLIAEHGLVPGRDFETFYGPGQPYLLAGAGEIFGLSVGLARVSALIFQIALALAIYVIVLPAGRWVAAAGALAASLVMLLLGLQGLAIIGGLAALLCGLALLVARDPAPGRARPGDRTTGVISPLLAGLAAAAALTFRPDLAPAVLLSAAPLLLWRLPGVPLGSRGRRWLLALIVGCIPLIVWLAVVGPDGISRLLEDLAASRPGRHLPLPGATSVEGGLLAATLVVLAGSIAGAALWLRRDPRNADGRVLLSIALLLIALLPSAVQRADVAHIAPVAAIAIGLSPIVARLLLDLDPPRPAQLALAGAGLIVAVALIHAAELSLRAQASSLSEEGPEVVLGDRTFHAGDADAVADLNELLPEIDRVTSPGDSIFVGTTDLTRTVYSDTFVYFMLPDLVPASFYTELNPGTANGEESTLPEELEDADVLLLTDRWTPDTDEAAEPGSEAAQEVVDERFCTVAEAGDYEVLTPCSASAR